MNRRRFVIATAAAAGTAGLAAGIFYWRRPRHVHHAEHLHVHLPADPDFPNPLRLPGAEGMFGIAEVAGAFSLVAKAIDYPMLPGKPARVLAYEMEHHGRTLFNPVLRARRGANLRIKFWNALPETSIIHWHGFKVDSNNDGHPHYAIPSGATYDYHFTVDNRAATYWYHPHPHHLTGRQVHQGLAGFFIVEDDEELALQRALGLKFGESDIPLLLHDRRIDADGGLVYAPTVEERFHGYYGSHTLVNWTRRPHLHAATRLYRFRILNGSTARLYRLAFRQGEQLLSWRVIGTDGGLLERPHTVTEAFLAPGERVDALLDLRDAALRDEIVLVSLPFDAMHAESGAYAGPAAGGGHAHHAHGHAGHGETGHAAGEPVPDGAELALLKIRVQSKIDYDRVVPESLSRIEPVAESPYSPRLIVMDQAKLSWRLNGRSYDVAATPLTVRRGSVEAWDIRNVQPSMPHPMHIHGFQFRIVSREGSPEQQRRLAVADGGLAATDLGWKDTVLVWPGETARIVTDFSHPFLGDQVYMIHCHNLEHEDGGMMLNLKVRDL